MQHSWDDIRNEYETTGITLKELADKCSISAGTMRSRKNREGWQQRNATMQRNDATQRKPAATKINVNRPEPSIESEEELTEKQQIFVLEYQKDFNATRAAMAAGYSKKTAYSIGWELLRKPAVQAANQRHKEAMTGELGLSIQRVIMEYMKIAFADPGDVLDFGQREVQVMGQFGPVFEGKGKDKKPVMQIVNYIDLKQASELDSTLIAEVKQGRDGVSIKMHDKMRALKELEKYLGFMTEEQKLQVEKLKAEVKKIDSDTGGDSDSGNIDQLADVIKKSAAAIGGG